MTTLVPEKFDVLILGAGPAGATTAIKLASSGLKVAVFDKATFPRTKTCGDGLTLDVLNQLSLVSESLAAAFELLPAKLPSYEAVLFSPDHRQMRIPFRIKHDNKPIYTCRRIDFDNFMFQQLKQYANITVFENYKAVNVEVEADRVVLTTTEGCFEGSMIVGADGANSMLARKMGIERITKQHQAVGLTAYYSGLQPLNENNPIEIYFLNDILPGYLWIFHHADGTANVGVGMLASAITSQGLVFKKKFDELIKGEPLRKRFSAARREGEIKGHMLPLGFDNRKISGERFLLAGDAAALIDPLTGEGVGNAIRSGRVASEHIINCFNASNFSAGFNLAYDVEVYRRVMPEYKMNSAIQKLCRYPWILNFFIGTAYSHPEIENAFNEAFIHLQTNTFKSKSVFLMQTLYIFTLQNLFVSVFRKSRPKASLK